MKKLGFFKKLVAFFALGTCIFALGACQSTGQDAKVKLEESSITIFKDAVGDRYAKSIVCVTNTTIYNTTTMSFHWIAYDDNMVELGNGNETKAFYLSHGTAGYAVSEWKLEDNRVAYIKVTEASLGGYMNVWDTYIGWWVAAITLVALSLIFDVVEAVRITDRSVNIKELFVEKVASIMFFMCLILLLCLFPLFFGNWVVALILLGGIASAILLAGLTFGIRAATLK